MSGENLEQRAYRIPEKLLKTVNPDPTPESRARYERIVEELRNEPKTKAYRESIRESQRITAEDLSTYVGPLR